MVDTAFSVVVKAAQCVVAVAPTIAQHFSYIRNYETNFDKLETELQKLKGQRDRVQNSVEEARRNGEQIEQLVKEWLDRVHMIIAEVSKVIEENERADMICFMGLCPNPKKRYQQSSKAVEKTEVVVGLFNEGDFRTVSFRTIPEETWIPSYKGYMVFESRMSTLKDILDELSNPNVNMVGIYGTGGIGKTMLAREVAAHAEEDKKRFNVVAFAEVAVKQDIKEIQKEIADKLGLKFTSEESVPGRARRLQQRLKEEEKVLLVLDNIWERLNLEDVGIPFGNDHKGCKLLLTARNLDVLSNKMDSQSNFEVGFLDQGEAWSLFEKKAGSYDHLQALAKHVADACGGLPIAINSVAVALKNKEEFEWKDALRKLTTSSTSNFEGVAAETYSSIEISYSQLKEEDLKSTFLLCCIMGYANVEDLLAYGMGLDMFKNVEAMEHARNRVNTLVRNLKDSSLLLDSNNGKFSLHDVVRDVGRSIASRDRHMFTMANNYIPREWVGKDILKNCVGISLYDISKLPEEFECPELQFFYLRTTTDYYSRVPDNFFARMPKLKVLHLAGLELSSVPNSIRLLVILRTLCIDDCKLRDVNFIGEFKQLEILRIRDSYDFEIDMIPEKMCNLTGLRLLDLSDCSGLRNIRRNVLSTFTQLEELYLPDNIKWEVEGVNILDELKHLKHLTALKISIPDDSVLPKGRLVSNKLERYNIIIGHQFLNWYVFHGQTTSRNVKLKLESSSCSDEVQKFLSLLDREGFPELEYLHVQNSPCFRAVVDCLESESCHHFLFLQSLSLNSVLNLEIIHNYPLKADSFRQLRSITVKFCHKLKNILSFSTYRALPLLQEVDVFTCNNMEEIFAIRREGVINNDEGTNKIEFNQLRSLKLHSLPKLTSFCSFNNNKDMFDTPTLLFNQKDFVADDQGEAKVAATFVFPRITSLELNYLPRLKTFYCGVHTSQWQNLKRLVMCRCDKVELFASELFNFQENNKGQHGSSVQPLFIVEKVTFPSLEEIKISKSKNLKILLQKGVKESFCNLKSIEVSDCNKLLTIFQFNTLEGLSMPKLLTVTISNCASVEEIFDLQKVNLEESHSRVVMYPQLQQLNINRLPKLKHIWKKHPQAKLSFEELPIPKSLSVRYCDSIEEIFDLQKVNFEEFHSRAVTNQLQELDLDYLPKLKHIWKKDPQAELSFENLQGVYVSYCQSLKDLFPASIARSLLQLVELNVENCEEVEEIVAKEGEAESAIRFVFPEVTSIRLNGLPQLRTFYHGLHRSKWTILKELDVLDCNKIESLASELFSFQENNVESHLDIPVQQPLFWVEKDSFPNLEKLKLRGEAIKMISQGQFSVQLYCNLKFLEVWNDESVVFPLCILQRFHHLQELHLHSSSYKEIFSYKEEETHPGMISEIRLLHLLCLANLKHIWKQDSKLDMVLQKLESLEVEYCDSLIQLVPSSASFQNLTILKVWGCDGLKNLMTSSTAKNLVQLREMSIEHCKSMKRVVAKEGDVTEDEITFSKLRTLTLNKLQSLSFFCSENYTFKLPSLEELTVYECPKMKYFSSGDVTAPILQKVKRHWREREDYMLTLEGDLNTTIQQIQDSRLNY